MTTDNNALAERLTRHAGVFAEHGGSQLHDDLMEAAAALREPSTPSAQAGEVELDRYDAGLLNDFGGGNVEWWQDYLRAELERAHEFYQSQITTPQPQGDASGEVSGDCECPRDHRGQHIYVCPHVPSFAAFTPKPAGITEERAQVSGGGEVLRALMALRYEAVMTKERAVLVSVDSFDQIIAALSTPQARPDGYDDGSGRIRDWREPAPTADGGAVAWMCWHSQVNGGRKSAHDSKPDAAAIAAGWQARPLIYGDTHPTPAPDAVAELREQVAEGKAQWDRVAKAIGADGDDVDDVFAKADAVARLVEAAGAAEAAIYRLCGESLPGWVSGAVVDLREALAALTAAQPEEEG